MPDQGRDSAGGAEMFGPYRIEGLLGRGGMGEVHRAYDTTHERFVALKRLSSAATDEEYRVRFRRESRIVARLRDPHVIPIHAFGEIDGRLYLDMRLVEGQDLRELLDEGRLDPQRAVLLLSQVATALDAAHADGLIHRDVKPSNVLVAARDFAYLADFGIAQSASPGATSLTTSGHFIGSLDYIAPERLASGPVDGRADVYSLACMLFECLTGRQPFGKLEPAAVLAAHLTGQAPRVSAIVPQIPPALDEVVARGMAKDPAHRPPTASRLMADAARALDSTTAIRVTPPPPPPTPPPTPPTGLQPPQYRQYPPNRTTTGPPQRKPSRRAPYLTLAAAVVTIAAVVVTVVLTSGSDGGEPSAGPGVGGGPTTTSSAPPFTTTTTTTTPTTTTTTTTTATESREVRLLREDLPSTYRTNQSCQQQPRGDTWSQLQINARIRCTSSNTGDVQTGRTFREPTSADFLAFGSSAAAERYFLAKAKGNDLTRDDSRISCISSGHEGTLYGKDGDGWLTCFRTGGSSYVLWADLDQRLVGELRADGGSVDAMERLYLWWNTSVLAPG